MAEQANYDRATELVHEIGAMIVAAQERDDGDWDAIAATAIVEGGVVQISGFYYDDGAKPKAARLGSSALADRFEALSVAMQKPDGGRWVTALVQVRRSSGRVTIDYDYADPARWKVTPANIATMPEALRPG
jgi:hypothetical protein